jgi:tetratricopeptide (TPR) repeat protein
MPIHFHPYTGTMRSFAPINITPMAKKKSSSPKKKPSPGKKSTAPRKSAADTIGYNLVRDLHKLLEKQDLKSEAEVNAFLEKIAGQPIPHFEPESGEDQAEELVIEAYSLPPDEGREQVEEALVMDPECITAYEYLGEREDNPAIAIAFFSHGVTLGEQRFFTDPKDTEQYTGRCWGFHETRPYMRCLQKMANCHYLMNQYHRAIGVWHHMLEMNPMDNQGIRYPLSAFLANISAEEFAKLDRQYEMEPSTFMKFNRALAAFCTHGAGPAANKLLREAIAANPHVLPMLLAEEPPYEMPGMYSMGGPEEAITYSYHAWTPWLGAQGAHEWLRKA